VSGGSAGDPLPSGASVARAARPPGQVLAPFSAGADRDGSLRLRQHILLLPRKCRVQSRSECDPSVDFGPRRFKLPVVPANMKTVLDEPIAEWLAANDHFYVMHRFDIHNLQFAKRLPGSFVIAGNVATPEALIDLEAGRHLVGLQQPGDARGLHLVLPEPTPPRISAASAGSVTAAPCSGFRWCSSLPAGAVATSVGSWLIEGF